MADATPIHRRDVGNVVLVHSIAAKLGGRLQAFADALGEDPADIVADAIALHLDRCEQIEAVRT